MVKQLEHLAKTSNKTMTNDVLKNMLGISDAKWNVVYQKLKNHDFVGRTYNYLTALHNVYITTKGMNFLISKGFEGEL